MSLTDRSSGQATEPGALRPGPSAPANAASAGAAAPAAATAPAPPQRLGVVLAALIAPLFLSALDSNIVATAMPTIVGEFRGFSRYSWITTAYIVTSTISTLVLGKLSDLLGRRVMLLFAIAAFLVGSVLCGASQSMTQLILFRALQGIGGGGIMALVFSTIGDLVAPSERGRYFGLFTSVFAFASLAGPLIGGVLVDRLNWRWVFYVNVPIGIVALVAIAVVLKLPARERRLSLDVPGALLVSGSIISLMLALEASDSAGWGSARVLGLLAGAVLLAVLLVFAERRATEPLLPLRMFGNDIVRTSFVLGLLTGGLMYASGLYLALYFQDVRFRTPTIAGLLTFPIALGISIGAQRAGAYISRTSRYDRTPLLGLLLGAAGYFACSRLRPGTSEWLLLPAMLLIGIGMGITMPSMSVSSQNAADPRDLGIVTSALAFFRTLGGALGLALIGTLFTARLRSGLRALPPRPGGAGSLLREPERIRALDEPVRRVVRSAITSGVSASLVVCAVVALLAWGVSTRLRHEPLRTRVAHEPDLVGA